MLQSSRKIHTTVFIQTAMAPSTDTSQWHPAWHHVQTIKVCQNHPRLLHPAMAPSNGTLLASINGIQQWHPTTWHPAMAPSIQQWHPASSNGTHHGIQQWHLSTAPSNGTTSSLSKCHNHSPPIASSNGTQQWHLTTWHPAMAPDHGTQQWHHVQSVKVCHNHSMAPTMASSNGTLPWHLTMAPSNGTTSSLLHPAMAPSNGTLPHGTQQWPACSKGTEQ